MLSRKIVEALIVGLFSAGAIGTMVAVAAFWIFLSVLTWAVFGLFVGWAFSGNFAPWEAKLGLSMADIGAMVGFVSAAFRVKLNKTEAAPK